MPTSEDEVPVSKFSPEDARLLEKVYSTGRSVVVTSDGAPMVVLIKAPPVDSLLEVLRAMTGYFQKHPTGSSPSPAQRPESDPSPASWLGSAAKQGRILGDLIEPACPPEDWEALRD
jgi:prevent-host-death family protein